MATYVNDLRLKEIGTGESSGTWGTETNVNLELIGEALSFGTEAITTNADTHTSTVADGSTDPARSMYIKYTGTLDSACTITIAPNTLSRLHFIENGTSGSQNIIISQGSGANVTIPPGDVKVVYLDGAGSGAAVVDAFASLNVVDLKVEDDLTVTDDLIVNGDIDLEGSIDVNGTANLDVVDIDGAVDMASTLQVDGAITSSSGATITVTDNSDTLSLISTDADANSGPHLRMYRNSSSPANNDFLANLNFVGRNDNTQDVQYGEVEVYITDKSDGAEDGLVNFNVITGGSNKSFFQLRGETPAVIVNEDGDDIDFRVETDGQQHAIFANAGDDRVTFFNSTTINAASGTDDGVSHYSDGRTDISRASAQALNLRRRTDDGVLLNFYKEASGTVSSVGSISTWSGELAIGRLNCALLFDDDVNRIKPASVQSSGARDDALDLGDPSHRFNDVWLGGGIHLGGTGDANKLNDYEQGTYNPTSPHLTFTATDGSYTKVGNFVNLAFRIIFPSSSSGTHARMNLPFTVLQSGGAAASAHIHAMSVAYTTFSNSQNLQLGGLSNAGYAEFFSGDAALSYSQLAGVQVNGTITFLAA
tara:strand:- start:815 stop:2593 length:1779 start_codon:yes stop_codon:yes gene_type:complete